MNAGESPRVSDDFAQQSTAEKLLELAVLLSQQNDFDEILRLVVVKGLEIIDADTLSIMMLNPKTDSTLKTLFRDGVDTDDRSLRLLRANVTGWVMRHKQSFLTENLPADPRFVHGLFAGTRVCSVICVPIQNERRICGHVLVTSQNSDRRFDKDDLAFLEKCAAVWGGFLNNARRIQEYFDEPIPDDVLLREYSALGLLGKSRRFKELLRSVDAAAKCDVRVFLEGQSGSGKERIARAIHKLGPRNQHPFVAIDCGAIPANLVESELFGHTKGAFTGASQTRKGLLEEANGGTLFMDEIGNLAHDTQAKLLRVLQEGEMRAVGSDVTRKVDVRIITASSTPAMKLVHDKTLREDLFYRLHVFPISVPTLNERSEDVPVLAEHFLKTFASEQRKRAESIEPMLVQFMQRRNWRGNVRELENFVERMVTLAPMDKTVLNHTLLPEEYRNEFRSLSLTQSVRSSPQPLQESLDAYEGLIIREALARHNGNQSEAARDLAISERTMRYKMERLGIEKHNV